MQTKQDELAQRTHCKNGHPWVDENVYVQQSTGVKSCNPCRRERARLQRVRQKEQEQDVKANIPAEFTSLWEAIGPAYRTCLSRIARNYQKRGEEVTLPMLLRLWSYQLAEGSESLAVCAGTGTPFDPAGMRGPALMRLKPDMGLEASNLVLVCQGYFHLRTLAKVYGLEGHGIVVNWMAQAVYWHEKLAKSGGAPFEVEDLVSEPPL